MTVEILSQATRKLTIAPFKENATRPAYQDLFLGFQNGEAIFKENPKLLRTHLAERKPNYTLQRSNHRQGDVILKAITSLPEGLKNTNTYVIAESVVTKNVHEFIYGDVEILTEGEDKASDYYINIISDWALLGHGGNLEEFLKNKHHKMHQVYKGAYKLTFQQISVDNRPIRVID